MGRLIQRFGEDDISVRSQAERELSKIGLPAVEQLREAVSGTDSETAGRCRAVLDRLARPRPGSEVELTALSLLAFLGAGYSHLSKDVFDGFCLGQIVRRGLEGLRSRQGEDGLFEASDATANVIAALAMSEAFSLTGAELWKDSARRGLAAVERRSSKDARFIVWKLLAVHSGERGGCWVEQEIPLNELFSPLADASGEVAVAGRAILEARRNPRPQRSHAMALKGLDPSSTNGEAVLFGTVAVRASWSRDSDLHRSWMQKVRERGQASVDSKAVKTCGPGEMHARLRAWAYHILTLETAYRYSLSLGESFPSR